MGDIITGVSVAGAISLLIIVFCSFAMMAKFYRKVEQSQALIRNGVGGTRVSFAGTIVIPATHFGNNRYVSQTD